MISGQRSGQVFVVELAVCGEGKGWRLGAFGRWRLGGYLGGIWEEVAGCGEGNCGVGCVGFTGGVSGDLKVFYVVERQGNGGG